MAWLPEGSEVDGKYVVIRRVGEGGMGQVYEAEDRHLGRRVALKLLPERHQHDASARERLAREGKLAARLQHPNVVRIYEIGSDGTLDYVAMELLHGEDLHARIRRLGPLPVAEVEQLAVTLANALSSMHALGIVHRDLKPKNLFLAQHGSDATLKVLDFGVAKGVSGLEESLTHSGQMLGTLHYMAPEQIRGAQHADARSDLWSLGAILYECLTARRPFDAESAPELLLRITTEPHTPLRGLRPDVPAPLLAVIERALDRDPKRRPQSAGDLLVELRRDPKASPDFADTIASGTALESLRPVELHSDSQLGPPPRRSTSVGLGVGVLLLSMLIARQAWPEQRRQQRAAVTTHVYSEAPALAVATLAAVAEVDASIALVEPEIVKPAPTPRRRRRAARVVVSAPVETPVPAPARDTSPAGAISLPEFFE